ncbi:glutamate-cysteine ligase family protein [Novosphingobium panipatense]|uniref:glutamate-cysteine ligase family protein n=1 Tax=Novosphingobium panipatense TaxID=428991 RepID=UPI003622BBD8
MKKIGERIGKAYLGLGMWPDKTREELPIMPKGRYDIMLRHMPRVGSMGLDMMLRTCTIQVNLDYSSEADMVQKFRTSLALQPLATALFANSPFTEGSPTASFRIEATSGRTPIRRAPACCPSSSKTASVTSAMSNTCWTCRCTSSSARAGISMRPACRSGTSSGVNCRSCPARSRACRTGRTIFPPHSPRFA